MFLNWSAASLTYHICCHLLRSFCIPDTVSCSVPECLLYIRYSRQYRWLCRWALLCIHPVLWSSLEYCRLSIPEPLFLWSKVPVEQVRWHLPWQTWNKPAFDLTNCINPADQIYAPFHGSETSMKRSVFDHCLPYTELSSYLWPVHNIGFEASCHRQDWSPHSLHNPYSSKADQSGLSQYFVSCFYR